MRRVVGPMRCQGCGRLVTWAESCRIVHDADGRRLKLQGVLDAVRTKKDMLVSLGASMRAEMQGDPSIRAAHAEARMYSTPR